MKPEELVNLISVIGAIAFVAFAVGLFICIGIADFLGISRDVGCGMATFFGIFAGIMIIIRILVGFVTKK